MRGAIGGFLGRKLNRAASKKAEDAADSKVKELSASTGDASSSALFKTVTEVVSISTEAASVGSFDVPPGYTKKSK